jgi:lysophospholipase L1-like esterase
MLKRILKRKPKKETIGRVLLMLDALLLGSVLCMGVLLGLSRNIESVRAKGMLKVSLMQIRSLQAPFKVLPLGDSITAGIIAGDPRQGGYRTVLWKMAQAQNWNMHFVGGSGSGPDDLPEKNHEGHPGARIEEITSIVPRMAQYRPQIVLLHAGTNDLINNVSPQQAADRMVVLLNRLTETLPDAVIIVAQIVPSQAKGGENIPLFNQFLAGTVDSMADQGKHITTVDMYHALGPGDLSDGIHPNQSGYQHMAEVWYQALGRLLG